MCRILESLGILLTLCTAPVMASAVSLTPIITDGLDKPVAGIYAPGEPNRLYVVEQTGRIKTFENGTLSEKVFLDISDRIVNGPELGLLGLAFHPQYESNGRFFLNYTIVRNGYQSIIAEFNKNTGTETEVLRFSQPYENHNGGTLVFGPDGYLYIGNGDGGSAGDPHGYSQNLQSLLGKMLRIDVDHGSPYTIPRDNPFANGGGRAEIWAYGLRNPWKFTFDRVTGRMFAGDVGQNRLEEVDVIERAGNYGWNIMEARNCYLPSFNCNQKGLTLPIHQYGRGDGVSITGGYVYRGNAIPSLVGKYIYGDYGTGRIWALDYNQDTKTTNGNTLLVASGLNLSSFGEEPNGEILVFAHNGEVYRLVKN